MDRSPIAVAVPQLHMTVGGLLTRPADARWMLVLGHGAGAGMRHAFMEALSAALASVGVATLRYQFPYMERGQRRPDAPATLIATVNAAVAAARRAAPDLPLLAGGKSLGGRMTSHAAAKQADEGEGRAVGEGEGRQATVTAQSEADGGIANTFAQVRGLVFFGFPLHAAGRPGTSRAAHLARVRIPMLFLQGTRDTLAELPLIQSVCAGLAQRATLHIVDGADHGFAVLKRTGRTASEVLGELASRVRDFAERLD